MERDDIDPLVVMHFRTFEDLYRAGAGGGPAQPALGAATAERVRFTRQRYAHLLRTDPGLAVVAVDEEGRRRGVAMALRRDNLWILSLLVVDSTMQSAGLGARLLEAVLPEPGTPGIIAASKDPRAIRLYARNGFWPTASLWGTGPVRTVPRADPAVREGSADDADLCESIDRALRGATRRPELRLLLQQNCELLVLPDRGYALRRGTQVVSVAATDEAAAAALLRTALSRLTPGDEPMIGWLTGPQRWAMEVVVAAGVALIPDGAICVRGEPGPLAPFIPTGPYL